MDKNSGEQFEQTDISFRAVMWVIGGLLLTCAVIMIVLRWTPLSPRNAHRSLPGGDPKPFHDIAGPRLQEHPGGEWQALNASAKRRLESYGWVNRDSGTVHIPIDRAIEMFLARGLQEQKSSPAKTEGGRE